LRAESATWLGGAVGSLALPCPLGVTAPGAAACPGIPPTPQRGGARRHKTHPRALTATLSPGVVDRLCDRHAGVPHRTAFHAGAKGDKIGLLGTLEPGQITRTGNSFPPPLQVELVKGHRKERTQSTCLFL
jgi:hypothetical protein